MSEFDRQKWNAKYQSPENAPSEPSKVLVRLIEKVQSLKNGGLGKALDLASGGGRHGIFLAGLGYEVTLCDISEVGQRVARERATAKGVLVKSLVHDLEEGGQVSGTWDLIVSVCYLHRPLFEKIPAMLSPGGYLVVVQPTQTNLERHDRPPAPFLLENQELPRLAESLEVVHYEEGWLEDGRYDAALIARKPSETR